MNQPASTSKKPQPRPEPTPCDKCGTTRKYYDGILICPPCHARESTNAFKRRQCGVSKRHAKFRNTSELTGPDKYLDAVRRVRKFAFEGDSVLAVIGRRGTGKTQMLAAIAYELIEFDKDPCIAHVGEVISDLRSRYGGDGDAEAKWLRKWDQPDLLVVDEIGELPTGDGPRAFTRLVDHRYQLQRPTIIAGNVKPEDLVAAVGASVADRCNEGGGIVQFSDWPSFRTQT